MFLSKLCSLLLGLHPIPDIPLPRRVQLSTATASFLIFHLDMDRRVSLTNYRGDENENDSSAVLSYIKQMLMEDDTEERYSMFQDSLALQNTERELSQVITDNNPPPPSPPPPPPPPSYSSSSSSSTLLHPSPEQSLSSTFTDYSIRSSSTSNSAESPYSGDEYSPIIPNHLVPPSNSTPDINTLHNPFLDSTFLQQFQRGVEQGTRFLPNTNFFPSFTYPPNVVIKTEEEEEDDDDDDFVSRGRRIREREECDLDGRSRKQSAAYVDENDLAELFDKVLLNTGLGKGKPPNTAHYQNDETCRILTNTVGGKSHEEVVDLRTQLMLCVQAVASDSPSFARQLIKQIKQHSSPTGDDTQRLAHYFGNALEARLDGSGYEVFRVLSSKRTTAKDMIKAYHVHVSVCPFEKLAIGFTINSILYRTQDKKTIHIIDFGIRYGFKWPLFISRLSRRPGGPPKVRITGIDQPQPGFRPQERVHETGRRLASYCQRFNVPFEFNAIAQRWDTIRVEDLKIQTNEFVVVNCMFQFEHLLDETVVLNNPRDAVLRLIKKANPHIFVLGIVSGTYDVPFFVSRFREALFHYSSLFDMLDTNVAREDPMRFMFEKELYGREIMNIVACEGCERIERPQTYKQWQLRNMRAGLRPLPLDRKVIEGVKNTLKKDGYNPSFNIEVDGNWMLQSWKGRVLHASSCWVPA